MSGFQNHQGAKLLDVIDKLRSLGSIRQDLSLPQIVVVGQQSSGKSSVLEAISGIEFPVSEGLCTRFATEVVLRRGPIAKHSASIHSLDRSEIKLSRIKGFKSDWAEFPLEKLPKIIEGARSIMTFAENSLFSEDILKIEVSGPGQDHLTLIDLPGFFISTRTGQKSGDKMLVDNLVAKYMDMPRAIVLAVVSGKTDLENQNVINNLQTVDREHKRTLGVITFPDAVERGSPNEATFQGLANNTVSRLNLGWHVMRNPSLAEKQTKADRKVLEDETFKLTPWRNLPAESLGASNLKTRLNRLLMHHVSQELEGILKDVRTAIEKLKLEIRSLGEERSTPKQQQVHLLNIAKEFKRLTSCAIEGEYRDDFMKNDPRNRLRAIIYDANLLYAEIMHRFGHKWQIEEHVLRPEVVARPHKWSHIPSPKLVTKEKLSANVQAMYQESRGRELPGTFQPALVGRLFRAQASRWDDLTNRHIEDVFAMVKDFFEVLLPHIAGEENSRSLLTYIIDPALEKRQKALQAKTAEILRPYMHGHPITLNGSFAKRLAKRNKQKDDDQSQLSDSDNDLSSQQTSETNQSYEVIHQMEAYYDVALGVLLDNVAILAIEQCLLDGLDELISPLTILQESDERMALLAGESEESISARKKLKQRLLDYEEGERAILPHVRRGRNISGHSPTSGAQQFDISTQNAEHVQRSRSQPPPTTQATKAVVASSTSPNVLTNGVSNTAPSAGSGGLFNSPSKAGTTTPAPGGTTVTASRPSLTPTSRIFDFSSPTFGQSSSANSANNTEAAFSGFAKPSGATPQLDNQELSGIVLDKAKQLGAYQYVPDIGRSHRALVVLKRLPQLSRCSWIRDAKSGWLNNVDLYRLASQTGLMSSGGESFEEIRLRDWNVIHGRRAKQWVALSVMRSDNSQPCEPGEGMELPWQDYVSRVDDIYEDQHPTRD